jgi:hypothetical protein
MPNPEEARPVDKEPEIDNTLVIKTLQKLSPYVYDAEYEK